MIRVVLITHALGPPARGNGTTVQRWLAYLPGAGVDARAAPADTEAVDPVPDVVHGYHALHGGIAARALAARYGRPLVISLGGTDVLIDDDEVHEVLAAADAVTGAVASFGERLGLGERYHVVPRGVTLPASPPPPRAPDGTLRVLLPAGLRPVKDPLLAIDLAARLARFARVELRIVGPDLDAEYAAGVRARAREAGFVTIEELPRERMPEAYAWCDVVWNTSLHEGGANSLLEALAYDRPVAARDVPGNRELLQGSPGLLFDPGDLAAFDAFHRALPRIDAAAWLRENHDPRAEAAALARVYRSVIGSGGSGRRSPPRPRGRPGCSS